MYYRSARTSQEVRAFFPCVQSPPPANAGGGLFFYAVYRSAAAAAFALRQLARSTGMSAVSAMSSLRE